MHFPTGLLTALVLATGAVADLHTRGWCVDTGIGEGFAETRTENNDATQKACDMYKNRNTGPNQWDRCPDCSTSFRGDLRVCNSPAKHLGGDEWNYYCRKAGADKSSAY